MCLCPRVCPRVYVSVCLFLYVCLSVSPQPWSVLEIEPRASCMLCMLTYLCSSLKILSCVCTHSFMCVCAYVCVCARAWRGQRWCLPLLFLVFQDRVSPGCPGTHSVNQAGLELRNPPASASQVLGLKACATTAQFLHFILRQGLSLNPELTDSTRPAGRWSSDSLLPAHIAEAIDSLLSFYPVLGMEAQALLLGPWSGCRFDTGSHIVAQQYEGLKIEVVSYLGFPNTGIIDVSHYAQLNSRPSLQKRNLESAPCSSLLSAEPSLTCLQVLRWASHRKTGKKPQKQSYIPQWSLLWGAGHITLRNNPVSKLDEGRQPKLISRKEINVCLQPNEDLRFWLLLFCFENRVSLCSPG
jgi:hypothetical protein